MRIGRGSAILDATDALTPRIGNNMDVTVLAGHTKGLWPFIATTSG